jgi:hypothetical protein
VTLVRLLILLRREGKPSKSCWRRGVVRLGPFQVVKMGYSAGGGLAEVCGLG